MSNFTSVGRINPNQIGFEPANQKMKKASVAFENTPGTVQLEDRMLLSDKATLQVTAPHLDKGALLADLKKLSEAAHLPFDESKVSIEQEKQKPLAPFDLSASHLVSDVDSRGREERNLPETDHGTYFVASAPVKIADAKAKLAELVKDQGDSLRYVEVNGKGGSSFGFYTHQEDEPETVMFSRHMPGQPTA